MKFLAGRREAVFSLLAQLYNYVVPVPVWMHPNFLPGDKQRGWPECPLHFVVAGSFLSWGFNADQLP